MRIVGKNTGGSRPSIVNGHAYLERILLSWNADDHSATKMLERVYEDNNEASFRAVYEQVIDGENYLFVANLELKADIGDLQSGECDYGEEIYWNLHVSGVPEDLDNFDPFFSPNFVNINAFKNGGWNTDLKGSWTLTEFGDRDTTNAPEGEVICKQAFFRSTSNLRWEAWINHDGGSYEYKDTKRFEVVGRIEQKVAQEKELLTIDEAAGPVFYVKMQSRICYGQIVDETDYLGNYIGYRKAPRWYVTILVFNEAGDLVYEHLLLKNGARGKNASNAEMPLWPEAGNYKNKELDFERTITTGGFLDAT